MKIILNHTLRSVKNHKGQIALIITTIAVVTIMIFVALSISGLFLNINISAQNRLAENTDIAVSDGLFPKSLIDEFIDRNKDKIEYADYYLQTSGLVKTNLRTKIIMLEVTDFKTIYKRYPHKLQALEVADYFEYPAVWIGKDFADELGVKAGDTLEIYYEGSNRYEKMSVSRVMKNVGVFANTGADNILVDFASANTKGMINLAHLKLYDPKDFDQVCLSLKEFIKNDALTIERAIDFERAEEIVANNTRLLNIALSFIMAIMVLILFTSYLVIAKSRLNEMIIFKSAGATPFQTTLIMLFEVLLYGAVGAAIGLIAGRLGMEIATRALLPNFPDAVTYNLWKYFAAFFAGVIISVIAALWPVIKISSKSIREMTSGIVKDVKYAKPWLIIAITLLLAISLTLLLLYQSLIVPLTVILIALFAAWVYMVTPYIIKGLSALFAKLKGQSRLASISIKRNSSSNTLAILVGSVITFSFIVVSVISLIITAITPYNTRYDADFVVYSAKEQIDYKQITSQISAIDGIEDAVYIRTAFFEIERENKKPLLYRTLGISRASGLRYATQGLDEEHIEMFEKTPHPAVINNDMAIRLNVKTGDKITVSRLNSTADTEYLEKLDFEFTVIALDYTVSEYDRVFFIKLQDMVYNGEEVEYEEAFTFVKAKPHADKQDIFFSMRDMFASSPDLFVIRFEDWELASSKGIEGVVWLLRILQLLVSSVAFVGIINLTMVTIFDRNKEFSIYKSSGMSLKKYYALSAFEGLIIALSGAFMGTALSFFFYSLMPSFASLINKYIDFGWFTPEIPLISALSAAVYTLIYFITARGNKRSFIKLDFYNERNLQ
jgi:ABC-type lipoprotein release transport system permease subunit